MDGATDEPGAAALPALGLHALHLALDKAAAGGRGEAPGPLLARAIPHGIQAVGSLYRAAHERGKDPPHPTAPLILAWLNQPPQVDASRHPRPLIPDIRVIGEAPERERGRLFGLTPKDTTEAQLPLFGGPLPGGIIGRVPLLGIADATTGGAVTAQGRGAPLELAVPVEAMLSIPPSHRSLKDGVTVAVTVRELRDALWPRGWQRNRDWPRLQEALVTLDRRTIPWGNGGLWWPVKLHGLPGGDAGLDELVTLHVMLPPGADRGTPIDRRRLSELRVHSGGAYRALIATAALAWQPGRTRVKAPGGGPRMVWTTNPERYPILTRQDRHDIIFGGAPKRRTDAEVDGPFEALEKAGDIIIAGREALGAERHEHGWRIMPAEAATNGLRARIAPAETDDDAGGGAR